MQRASERAQFAPLLPPRAERLRPRAGRMQRETPPPERPPHSRLELLSRPWTLDRKRIVGGARRRPTSSATTPRRRSSQRPDRHVGLPASAIARRRTEEAPAEQRDRRAACSPRHGRRPPPHVEPLWGFIVRDSDPTLNLSLFSRPDLEENLFFAKIIFF